VISLAVISDTHGTLTKGKIKGLFPPDSGIITLGDITNQELGIIKDTYRLLGGVKGNCDKNSQLPVVETVEIDCIRLFLTHSPFNITIPSREENSLNGYDVFAFGHLHTRFCWKDNGIVFFSPGAFSEPRDNHNSAGIIEISEGKCDFKFVDVTL
jgi:putative phosphoesterase|tara:strand:+ start:293 stop:757 length:465 start_codon:yes stop_codon:yes gene_type:complete